MIISIIWVLANKMAIVVLKCYEKKNYGGFIHSFCNTVMSLYTDSEKGQSAYRSASAQSKNASEYKHNSVLSRTLLKLIICSSKS